MIRFPLFGSSGDADANASTAGDTAKPPAPAHPLDETTGGVFSAATSGERAAKLRAWLASEPTAAAMQEVYKELSARDKGAAKALREKLDELKRSKGQEALAAEWADKAQALLAGSKLHIADAMAWQRDAAKAGAPLSKEPLSTLKNQLAERIKGVEDLQTRVQIQREAAVLLAQRIELLSTKSWNDADTAEPGVNTDVAHWHTQASALAQDTNWGNVDPKYATQLESATKQLEIVAQAFADALAQTRAASSDAAKPLPPVPVWADELRALRGVAPVADAAPATTADPEKQARQAEKAAAQSARKQEAQQAIAPLVQALEHELANGHSKASMAAAQALRNAMKSHARFLESSIEAQAHAALAKAGELEGWQRWRADQIRQELVQKAEALIHRETPPAAFPEIEDAAPAPDAEAKPATSPDTPAPAEAANVPAPATQSAPEPAPAATPVPTSPHSPRKLQDQLRQLREQWKQTDQGGVPNHALWKRFDQACNEAYRIVEAWLGDMKQHAAEQKAARMALLAEVKTWGEQLAAKAAETQPDWKAAQRDLAALTRRWREAGHLSEKVFAELQPQWKEALALASQPLEAAQKTSIALRQQMIEEATALGAAPTLHIDAVKALQQRWQHEAQRVLLERRQEQKLWDAFRKPIDDAFQRKSQQREQASAALNQRDQAVIDAAQALEAANASGNAQAIRSAMQALEAAMSAQEQTATAATEAVADSTPTTASTGEPQAPIEPVTDLAQESSTDEATVSEQATDTPEASEAVPEPAPAAAPKAAPKPVIAMRGDDRPGAKKPAAAPFGSRPARDGRRDDRRDGGRDAGRFERPRGDGPRGSRPGDIRSNEGRFADRGPRAPRLGDAAFRAQRDALDNAQAALRKLAAQAHGETLTQLMDAWQKRQADAVPAANELGKAVSPQQRSQWLAALGGTAPQGRATPAGEALLRLEMAAEVPTPAEQLDARRALQLQLLTRRNDPAPAQTWATDVAHVLNAPFEEAHAKRLHNTLRVLLKK